MLSSTHRIVLAKLTQATTFIIYLSYNFPLDKLIDGFLKNYTVQITIFEMLYK